MPFTTLNYKVDSDVVKTEGRNRLSRDEVVLPTGTAALKCGALVSRLTSGGAYAAFAPAATNGAQTPVGIMLQDADASTAAKRVVVLSRHAEIVLQAIEWPAGTTDSQKTAALAALELRGIVARKGV